MACDTMNYWIDSKPAALKKLLAKVDVFFSNDQEAMKLTGAPNALQAAEVLSDWGPSVVVVKSGLSNTRIVPLHGRAVSLEVARPASVPPWFMF